MSDVTITEMKQAHKLLAEYHYSLHPVRQGYANRTLSIDLGTGKIAEEPVTDQMKEIFTGGKGFGLKLLWDAVNEQTNWDDPENAIVITGGPIGGMTAYPGLGKSTVVTISPLTGIPIDSNVGGYFGPYLKHSGFDALAITGIAERDVIIVIDGDNGTVRLEEAPLEGHNTHEISRVLTDMYAASEKGKKHVSVVSAGVGADSSRYGILNFSWYEPVRGDVRVKQAGRGGTGTVFRHKKIKALVVIYSGLKSTSNNPVNMDLIIETGKKMNQEVMTLDPKQNHMRNIGTGHLPVIMNRFDLFPVHNFRYGSHPRAVVYDTDTWFELFRQDTPDGCWLGCTMQCSHGVDSYIVRTGPYAGLSITVDGPEYETIAGLGSNLGIFDPLDVIELNFYCDTYGLDTISFGNSVGFAMECFTEGIINETATGGLQMTWGNAEAAFECIHQVACNEGFGAIVGQGVRFMKKHFAEAYNAPEAFLQDIGMEVKGLEISEYMTKESLAQQGGYGMALKGAQHDEAWLIFMDMVNKQLPTFEAKAEALHYFPLWRTWFSLHGLCKLLWNDVVPEDNNKNPEPAKVPLHVENYTKLFEGLTGKPTKPEDLIHQSEKVYNFQRLFALRMGHGTRADDYPPYRVMGPVTVDEYESRAERYDNQLKDYLGLEPETMPVEEKMVALRTYREAQYEKLMDAVYYRRGWDENGVPTLEKVRELGINLPEVEALLRQYLER